MERLILTNLLGEDKSVKFWIASREEDIKN